LNDNAITQLSRIFMHTKNIITSGRELAADSKVLILLHGRGGRAEDILSVADYLDVEDFALLAPQAAGNTWYPSSFMAPVEQNEPWLSSALYLLKDIVNDMKEKGVSSQNMYFLGFSQGACLMLEFVARHATRYGGVVAFTGGLIGDTIDRKNYAGDFEDTPVFIGTGDPDGHVPVGRVYATTNVLKEMNARVALKVYPHRGHTISQDEFELANRIIFPSKRKAYG
jgi:phospholipase/carboxylesterase